MFQGSCPIPIASLAPSFRKVSSNVSAFGNRFGIIGLLFFLLLVCDNQAIGKEQNSLHQQISTLRQEVAQLRQERQWLTLQREEELTTLVRDVLADADTRSSLFGNGMNAGYQGGFIIGSADGNFSLKMNGVFHLWAVYNNSDGGMMALDQDDIDGTANGTLNDLLGTFYDNEVGFGDFYFRVAAVGAVTDAQLLADLVSLQTNLGVNVINALANLAANNDVPWNAIAFADRQVILDFFDGWVDGFSSTQEQLLFSGLTFTDADGNPIAINNAADYRAFMQEAAQRFYDAAIQNPATGQSDQHRYGFEARRMAMIFSGNIINPQWKYFLLMNFGRGDGVFDMVAAYIAHRWDNGWEIRLGKFKNPFMRELLVSFAKQLAIERSVVNSIFSGGYVDGIRADYQNDHFGFSAAVTDGSGSTISRWDEERVEWALTGRVEYLAAGSWKQFGDFTSPPNEDFGCLIGMAAHLEQDDYGTGGFNAVGDATQFNNDERQVTSLTADLSLEFGGANLYAAAVYRHVDSPLAGEFDQWGLIVHGGLHITDNLEAYFRYEWIDYDIPDLTIPGGVIVYRWDDLNLLTVGCNYYFAGHQIKLSCDVGYAFDRVEFMAANSGAGWRSNTGGDDGQWVFRSQWQFMF